MRGRWWLVCAGVMMAGCGGRVEETQKSPPPEIVESFYNNVVAENGTVRRLPNLTLAWHVKDRGDWCYLVDDSSGSRRAVSLPTELCRSLVGEFAAPAQEREP